MINNIGVLTYEICLLVQKDRFIFEVLDKK